jgi:hypothetical protein
LSNLNYRRSVLAASNAIELERHGLGLGAADYVVRLPYPVAAGKSALVRS